MAQNVGASAISPDELKTFPVFPVSIVATHGFCKKGHFDLMEVGLLWKKSRDSQFIMRCYSKLMIPSTVRWTFEVTIPYSLDLYTAVSEFKTGWRGSDFVGFHGWDFPSVSSYSRKVAVRHEDVELAPVVHKVDNAINRRNLYPLDSAIGFPYTYQKSGQWFIRWIALSIFWTAGAW